ncbi:MAG: glutaminase [Paramuribaculum sp.]|nr:glutaminase [Paramuribaculum sp.]MDE6489482.1 glutaminase [Paramuribaculum sp.]
MERHIKLADVEAVVKNIYEKYKDADIDGQVDPRLTDADASRFGIVVTLTDGRTIAVGDTDVPAPMDRLVLVPVMAVHREQKLGNPHKCHCGKDELNDSCKCRKPEGLNVCPKALRLVSKIQPKDDADGKYGVIESMIVNMMGSAPVLNDSLYEAMTKANIESDVENKMAAAGIELYDDASSVISTTTKLRALQADLKQMAMMGATLAADGRNPLTGEYAFDGEISPKVVAFMAVKGPRHLAKKWLMKAGLPAMSSFGGTIMGVYPGVMSIAAYSPVVNPDGVSIKAYKAIHHIMKHLDLNVFDSAKTIID